MPIYLVKSPSGDKLVEAPTKAGAINHVVRNTVTAEALNPSKLVEAMQDKGMKVEKVAAETTQPATAAA